LAAKTADYACGSNPPYALLEDGAQRAFGHVTGMVWDRGVSVKVRVEPDLMRARSLAMEFQAERLQTLDDVPITEARQCTHQEVTVRSPQSADSQKAESLAKPFSKHAAFVLKAYMDAMNDPLCVMPLGVRKELYPGLFSLCDMINEYSRDAMMVSALDAGGKATMKALWNEYEKQKYVGKG